MRVEGLRTCWGSSQVGVRWCCELVGRTLVPHTGPFVSANHCLPFAFANVSVICSTKLLTFEVCAEFARVGAGKGGDGFS